MPEFKDILNFDKYKMNKYGTIVRKADNYEPSAESGVLVGKSDINSREGIIAQQPDGSPIRLGGGEIIMSEKASTDNCEELSKMNVEGGGVAFDCDLQKVANTDRASGKMPKDEYHHENAAKGTQAERTHYEEAHRYIDNAKATLEKSNISTDGKYYEDEKYVKSAAGIAYAGVEQAAVWYIKLRGIEMKGSGIDAIKDALSKIDKRMLKMINYLYTGMHVDAYYRGYTKKIVIDDLMKEAESFIAYLKPYKEIAHYDNGGYIERTYYEEAHRYIDNAKATLGKSNISTDGKYYDDTKYVKSAAGIAYAGAEMAAKWFIKLRGIELKGRGIEQIKDAISKIDRRVIKIVNSFYNTLHLNIYYGNETNKKIVDAAIASAEEMVNYLRPYKEIAHYDKGKYFKHEKKSVEQFLDDYNLPGFDVKLKFDNKPETFFTLKQSRPRLNIWVKDMKNKEWMFLITRITSVDGRKVDWVDSNAAGGMEGLVPQGKLYDRSVSKMYKKVLNETESAEEFNRIYEKKLKELATKYNISSKYFKLK